MGLWLGGLAERSGAAFSLPAPLLLVFLANPGKFAAQPRAEPENSAGGISLIATESRHQCALESSQSSMPLFKDQTWEETTLRGPPLYALCIGNDKYASSNFAPLTCCVRDAKGVAQEVNSKLGTKGGYATSATDLTDKEAMESAIKDFLSLIRLHGRPPRMVMIYVSGHAVQEGDQIFLVPTRASPTSVKELRQQCLSHDDIFRILKSDLADKDWPDQGACTSHGSISLGIAPLCDCGYVF